MLLNSLLHRLFLDHDIIFLVLNTFENIMENGAFAPKDQMHYSNTLYFKGIKSIIMK